MIRSSRRSSAITNKIKTYFTTYIGKEVSGEIPSGIEMQPLRVGDNSVAGTAEEITSDIILPDTRIPSTPEIGSESNSGDVSTEWNIDEQDDLFAAVFCSSWETVGTGKKSLTLADTVNSFAMLKKYPQTPEAWQLYKKMYVNQLTMDFATDAFVKLTWNFMGSNNPSKVFTDPLADKAPVYKDPLTTKSFLTKKGWLKYGDSTAELTAVRQSPSMNITINNNMERTPALFEEESIENSLGDFVIDGSFDVYNVDDLGHQIYNDAVQGKDKVLQVRVQREVDGVTYSYTLTMNVHLKAPSESKNGNKLQFSVGFQVNAVTDLLLEKEVDDPSIVDAETPTFSGTLSDATYTTSDTPDALIGTATVEDGGTVTYQWYTVEDGTDTPITGETNATYTPDVSTEGVTVYKVIATNTNAEATGSTTATAEQHCTITVAD